MNSQTFGRYAQPAIREQRTSHPKNPVPYGYCHRCVVPAETNRKPCMNGSRPNSLDNELPNNRIESYKMGRANASHFEPHARRNTTSEQSGLYSPPGRGGSRIPPPARSAAWRCTSTRLSPGSPAPTGCTARGSTGSPRAPTISSARMMISPRRTRSATSSPRAGRCVAVTTGIGRRGLRSHRRLVCWMPDATFAIPVSGSAMIGGSCRSRRARAMTV